MDELLESNPELLVRGLIACQATHAALDVAEYCEMSQEIKVEVR